MDEIETSRKVAFAARFPNFERKNATGDDAHVEYERRSFCGFAAEIRESQQKWTFVEVSNCSALVVQRIECGPPKPKIKVRFLAGAPCRNPITVGFLR